MLSDQNQGESRMTMRASAYVPPLIRFIDTSGKCLSALKVEFAKVPNCEYEQTDISTAFGGLPRPCSFIDAGNGFGLMDGGIDGAFNRFVSPASGPPISDKLQKQITDTYGGEQPVGTCLLVDCSHTEVDVLAYCPTMRTPCDVRETYNAYLAFRSALWIIKKDRPDIKSIVSSALCTGAGRMTPEQSAKQMRLAWDSVFEPDETPVPDWRYASYSERKLAATIADAPKSRVHNTHRNL